MATKDEWKRVVQELLARYTKHYNKKEGRELLDLSGPVMKRRTDVILSRIDDVYRRYSDMLECMPDEAALGKGWIWLNLPHQTYTSVEGESSLLFGAAIWILDQIDGFENRMKLYKLLPKDDDIYDEMYWPDVWDSKHDYFLIADVMYLLQERHTDISEPEYITGTETRKVFTDTVNAVGKQSAPCPSMDRYRKLISLIPQESIDWAVERYKELCRAWTDRYFKCFSHLMREIKDMEEQTDDSRKRYNEARADFIKKAGDYRGRAKTRQKCGEKAGLRQSADRPAG